MTKKKFGITQEKKIMKNLVIVESPTKAKTIGKFLGSDYEIKASMGHVMDLPKSTLGVDVEHNFEPQYELMKDKGKIISELKSAAKKADSIILATDPDREGEAIASHVKDMLGSKLKFQRIVFHEITKEAVEEALNNPRSIDNNLVDAQTARRVLDRLVGYKLSPLLWQKVRRGLSAGRVQSVALRLIVEREKEIEKFKKEEYWSIAAILKSAGHLPHVSNDAQRDKSQSSSSAPSSLSESRQSTSKEKSNNNSEPAFSSFESGQAPGALKDSMEFELIEINGERLETQEKHDLYDGEYRVTKTIIKNEDQAKKIEDDLKTKQFIVSDVIQKETQRSPQPPFTTSTLQQDAARRFGFSGKRTMSLAQKLYEEGFITYHRTDSLNLSASAILSLRTYIEKEYGNKFLPTSPRIYKTKQKLAQEAHEAIRPTKVESLTQNSNLKTQILMLGRDYFRLYELIWRRAVACQMANAIIESTTVIVDGFSGRLPHVSNVILGTNEVRTPESDSGQVLRSQDSQDLGTRMTDAKYRLKANGSVLVFEGFLRVNPQALEDKKLPKYETSENLNLLNVLAGKHETPPPPRYNDASLIKTLEEKGIGRPSTYAAIISTIESRLYIERAEGKFIPTSVGIAVTDFLVSNFSDIDDIPFTAEMEDHLDRIASGEKEWAPMMKEFYKPFAKKLEFTKDAKRVKIEVEKTDEKCEKCGSEMVVRIGKFGKFLSCSKFPECKFSKPFVEETNLNCPKCNNKIIVKKTKRGRRFYGCSSYPACNFAAWKLDDIK